jgi:hypothetical protein
LCLGRGRGTGAGCLRRCRLFQHRRAARLGSAARMASAPAVPPPVPLFVEFVSEPSQAAPPLGGQSRGAPDLHRPAIPRPALLPRRHQARRRPRVPRLRHRRDPCRASPETSARQARHRVFVVFSHSSRRPRAPRLRRRGDPCRACPETSARQALHRHRVFVVFSHSSRPTRRQRLPLGQPRRGDRRPPRRQCRLLRPRGRQLRRPHPLCRKRARRAPARHIRPAAAWGLCRDFQIWDLRGVHRRPQFRRHRGQPRRHLARQIQTQFYRGSQHPSALRLRPDVPVVHPIGRGVGAAHRAGGGQRPPPVLGRAVGAGGGGGSGGTGNWCMGSWHAGIARGVCADWCMGFCQARGGAGGGEVGGAGNWCMGSWRAGAARGVCAD